MAEARGRRRSRRRARIIAAVVVVVLAGGGGAAWAMTSSSGPTYRTATATVAAITQSLNSVGTVQTVDKAVVSFPVGGRVASVSAVVGHPVTAGDVLATLDTTSLDQAVNQANQTVADDQRKLADDQTGQLSSASSSTGAGSSTGVATDSAGQTPLPQSPPPSSSSAPSGPSAGSAASANPGGAPTSALGAVTAAQQRLTRDQRALDAFLTDAALTDLLDLIGPSGTCAMTPATATTFAATTNASGLITVTTPQPAAVSAGSATVSAGQQGTGGFAYTITGSPNTAYTVSVTPSTGSIDAATCTGAIQKLVAALDPSPSDNAWVAAQAVNSDELALAGAISKLETSSASTGTGRSSSGSGAGSSQRTGSSSTSSASSTGKSSSATSATTATPEQLAADQAAIDAAQAQLAVANQNRDQATIRAPITGTVADVALTAGAAAGSKTVTIIGTHEVSTAVSLAEVNLVKVGDRAQVTVDGIAAPISGRVTSVGVLNSTTGSTTTFPVTVLLDPTATRLFDGAGAAVSIVVGTVTNALSVPSSAVHGVGALHTVEVLRSGKVVTTVVSIGAVGIDRTQITSGLSAGQRVVLAQLNAPLPTTGTTGRGLGRAGLGGGVLGGTGLTGTGLTGKTRVGG